MAAVNWATVVAGAVAGLVAGWLAWFLGGWYAARYRALNAPAEAVDDQGIGDVPPSFAGAITTLASIALAGMALWGAYVGWQATGIPLAISALLVTAILVAISIVDFQTRRIPNALVIVLLGWAPVQILWLGWPAPTVALLGLLVGGGAFLLLAVVSRGAMGMGDVKLVAAIGALVGFPQVLPAMLLGVIAGGLAALFLLLTRRVGRKDPMAYGPYLALGGWIIYVGALGLWPNG